MVYDLVKVKEKMTFRQTFTLHPPSWDSSKLGFRDTWDWRKFEKANQVDVPEKRGIYAFIVEPEVTNFPHLGFPMYIGISKNLHTRYGDYLRYQKSPKHRPHVHYFLHTWKDHVYFYFADIPRRKLEPIETSLNDAVLPAFSSGDFSADVRQEQNVLRHT